MTEVKVVFDSSFVDFGEVPEKLVGFGIDFGIDFGVDFGEVTEELVDFGKDSGKK